MDGADDGGLQVTQYALHILYICRDICQKMYALCVSALSIGDSEIEKIRDKTGICF